MKTNLNRNVTAIMLFVVCLLFSVPISAQDIAKDQAEERAKNMTEQMQKKLSLTDAQYQSVYTINLKYAKKNEQLKIAMRIKWQNSESLNHRNKISRKS